MDDDDHRINFGYLDPEVHRIITCLKKLNCLTDNVIECMDNCCENDKKTILFCLLLNRLDNLENQPLSCATDSVQVCGQGIDGVTRTIQQDTFGTISILPNASAYSQAGRLFSVVDSLQTSGSNIEHIAFENPPNNGRTMYLENVSVGISIDQETIPRDYEETLTVDISRAVNVTTGPVRTPINLNLGSSDASTLTVSNTSTFSGLSALSLTKHPTGECSLNFAGQIIVPPGQILLVSYSDNRADGRIGTLTATVTWFEL